MQDWIFDVRSRPFFLLVVLLALLTAAVYYGLSADADSLVLAAVQSAGGQNGALDLAMEIITETGDVYYMLVFGAALLIIRRTRRIGLTIMISLVIVTIITGYAKCAIDRDRPDLEYLGGALPIGASADTFSLFCDSGYNESYPSGHASRAAVFGVALAAALYARLGAPAYLLLLYPALVSASRVYVIQHYPTDVAGGLLLGVLITGIIAKKVRLGEPPAAS